MKETIKRPFIVLVLVCMTAALFSRGHAKEKINTCLWLYSTADEMIFVKDTTQAIQLPKANEFNGILVIDEKIEPNPSKIKDKEFTKRVKKVVIRKRATPEDVKKYGTKALNGMMFITTK